MPSEPSNWANPVNRLKFQGQVPPEAIKVNVDGLELTGPLHGFGQLWEKKFSVRLSGVSATPAEVIRTWKENFPRFWPKGNNFYAPVSGLTAGDVALLNLAIPGTRYPLLSTGVMVIYADDESFTFMTPQGHMFSGWITFSAFEDNGCTVAQAEALVRATDPIYEIGMRVAGSKEDEFWQQTLTALAAHFGVAGQVQTRITLLDPRLQWSEAYNVWRNAGVRSVLYRLGSPFRRLFGGKG
ncbi:MAG TPA: hypothetical protein VMT46_02235 [Anaerolineaceae bacterium]|nr:hypothetical protein [Anaerolineaceae bacterium]